jgi:HPt (histidine-containing phosphotransfer) domain-containing protein
MSDEFISLATKEVNADIEGIENILKLCSNDDDIFQNSQKFQKHTHKIKGLSPMMGKEELGNFVSLLDEIFKEMNEGKLFENIFDVITLSIIEMKKSMNENDFDFSLLNDKIKQL